MNEQPVGRIDLSVERDLNAVVEAAADVMRAGGVVLIPTDTVYGLICMPGRDDAIEAIFRMKDRPVNRHLPIIVADEAQARDELPLQWNAAAAALARAYWPGALTLACGIRENDVPWLRGRVEAGVRAPDFKLIQALSRRLGPLLMTSANRSGVATPHTVEGALQSLVFAPRLVIDGGTLSGAPSTLVNVNLPAPAVERVGVISEADIREVLNHVG